MQETILSGTSRAVFDINDLEQRRELLIEILDRIPGKPIFNKLLNFYRNIFRQKPDLVIFMSRKSWRVVHLFLPFLQNADDPENDGIDVELKKLTHDQMVQPWFAELDESRRNQIKKVFVIDDTLQTGRALDKCIRRLLTVYKVDINIITVSVFAMTKDRHGYNKQRIDEKEKKYTVRKSPSHDIKPFKVSWEDGGEFIEYNAENVSAFSNFFVEALHACSEPYVGYIPAFRLPIEDVQEFLGAERGKDINFDSASTIRVPGYLEQDDLRAPLNDPAIVGYYNITNQQMRQNDIEAFYISLPALDSDDKTYLPFLPPKHALSIAALRFYLNRKTGIALIVPYISLKDCDAEADIAQVFPKQLRPLLKEMYSKEEWKEYEGRLAAYRLLRYASGYLWGKYVFNKWFGRDVKKEDIASTGGICSDVFFDWLNGSSAEKDLTHIWSFFAPEKGHVVEKTEMDSETSLKDIIHRYLSEDQANNFCDFICNDLSSVSAPVDYFGTASMIFRRILDREYEMLNEHAKLTEHINKKDDALPEPFLGFPLHAFFSLLLLQFPKLETRKDVLTTVTLMLCDMGIAVTQLQHHGNIIGTVLVNGEQSCHALATIAPEYAHFLSRLSIMLSNFENKEQCQEKFEMARTEIKKYFEEERKQGMNRRLSLDELMVPLKNIRAFVVGEQDQDFIAYSTLPRDSFFDCSELFFLKLSEKLKLREGLTS